MPCCHKVAFVKRKNLVDNSGRVDRLLQMRVMINSLFEYAGQMSFRSVLAEIATRIAFGRLG